jgi:hypothetical protein
MSAGDDTRNAWRESGKVMLRAEAATTQSKIMPGHLIEASCGCGFSTDLNPGSRLAERGFTDQTMAYTEDGNDIDTFEANEIAERGLKVITDPYLCSSTIFDDKLPAPIACPRCKHVSLFLHRVGHWD